MAIPPIIHQTWKTSEVPERFRQSVSSWQRHHPRWQHRLWTDEDLDRFVADEYPEALSVYRSYREPIQRVDAARYMILHRFGGIYSDLDIVCLRPFDDLQRHRVVLPDTAPVGVSNDLMMAEAGHPFFRELVDGLAEAQRRWDHGWVPRHFRVLLTTGSLYLTGAVRRSGSRSQVTILDPGEYRSGDPEVARVEHLPGNTWAKWDTHVLSFLQLRWRWVVALLGGAAMALAWLLA